MSKIFWYSRAEKALVDVEPSDFELQSLMAVHGVDTDRAKALRLESLDVIPVIPVWAYGTLMCGESNFQLMQSIALPEFKPVCRYVEGIEIYSSKEVHFPAAILAEGKSTYMERFLVRPSDIPLLDRYEGAPNLYELTPLPDGEGWFYKWNKGLTDWEPISGGDWRQRII